MVLRRISVIALLQKSVLVLVDDALVRGEREDVSNGREAARVELGKYGVGLGPTGIGDNRLQVGWQCVELGAIDDQLDIRAGLMEPRPIVI